DAGAEGMLGERSERMEDETGGAEQQRGDLGERLLQVALKGLKERRLRAHHAAEHKDWLAAVTQIWPPSFPATKHTCQELAAVFMQPAAVEVTVDLVIGGWQGTVTIASTGIALAGPVASCSRGDAEEMALEMTYHWLAARIGPQCGDQGTALGGGTPSPTERR
ncbi:MAG: hypothetical protein K0U66_03770, partial [Gammaproteobacteria bacterium]|nr:hypothetical protein [Gammaproteobacteria bacterium]